MALMRLTCFRHDKGYSYYLSTRMDVMAKPTIPAIEEVPPEQALYQARTMLPKKARGWLVVPILPAPKRRGWVRYGVRILRADKFIGPVYPEEVYDFETAASIWIDYIRMLNLPRRIKP